MEKQTKEIVTILERLSLEAVVEILSAVMLTLALRNIEGSDSVQTMTEITDLVLKDTKSGETIANSLARQALLMMIWLGR